MKVKCGFVAVIGKPNAGKSSLVNAIVGEKVSIVSPRPQTTRNNILGIYNDFDCQIIFVDTPGINATNSALDKYMQRSIKGAVEDVNAVILVVDIKRGMTNLEKNLIEEYSKKHIPIILVLSKCDLVKKEEIYSAIESLLPYKDVCQIVPLSSLKHKNIDSVIKIAKDYLNEVDERFFSEEEYTDKSVKFLVAEIVREKALFLLKNEIPHGIAVVVDNYHDGEKIDDIDLTIICEKDTHKGIILGHNGSMLKEIGHTSRITIQKVLQKKVNLNIFVKVKPNWKNNIEILTNLGYDINDL